MSGENKLSQDIIKNMQYIVDECMGDSDPGCVTNCPMHTDVKRYVYLIRSERGEDAIKCIREKLFIPGTLGRICAHPCESNCKWKENKSPISIATLKRYAADNFDKEELWDLDKKDENGKKVAIIGCGPSGMQAAIDLRKEGCKVTIYEKLPVRGGWLAVGIPEYRLPRNILKHELTYLDKLGIEIKENCEVGKDITFDEILKSYDSIVIAVGRQGGRIDKSLKNHDAIGIYSAADFLREVSLNNKTVKNVGQKVLVVGGGDVAMDCCRTATRLEGVEVVNSICLEDTLHNMTSSHEEVHGAVQEGVLFNHAAAIKDIIIDENNRVCKVNLKECLQMFDDKGGFNPKFGDEVIKSLDVDTIVFAIGQITEGDFVKGKINQRGNTTFECDKLTLQSLSNPKVFIAGDASGESVIVIQAMATGRRAAESVIKFLNNEDLLKDRKIEDTTSYSTKLKRDVDWTERQERRVHTREIGAIERKKSFKEVSIGFSKEEALREANRCLQCECRLCMKECLMLNDFTDCPKTLFEKYLKEDFTQMDNMVAYSCNQCKQCTLRCPKDLKIRDNFIEIKEKLAKVNGGLVPLEQLKPSDVTQALECSSKYCTAVPKKKKVKYVFAPGCTVPAYTPELTERTLKHLKEAYGEENVGALLQCCGKVTLMIGEKDRFDIRNKQALDIIDEMGAEVIITVCPSCYRVYSDTAKQKVISYWELIRNEIGLPEGQKGIGKNSDVVFNIQDPCITRDVVVHHMDIRWILDELGYKYEEMNFNGENTRCCGVGGLVCNADPKLYERLYYRRAADCTTNHVVTYCGSCRGTMEAAGKDSLHILDLIHGGTYMNNEARVRGYSSEEEMWAHRLETKDRFNKYE
ncbi:MAG: FAD-dependent oxidoreductase [Clostridium sp.]